MNVQCSPHCRANAFISDTLNGGGLRLYPFTPLFNSYKPANLPCISMSWGKQSVKAGVCWHGSDGVTAKNTFKIGGGPSSLLSSGRSTPQPLNSSFIPAFITIRALSSSTSSSSFFLFFSSGEKEDVGNRTVSNLRLEKCFHYCLLRPMF